MVVLTVKGLKVLHYWMMQVCTKTYINSNVAAELGLQEPLLRVNFSVLNGHTETFETFPLSIPLKTWMEYQNYEL